MGQLRALICVHRCLSVVYPHCILEACFRSIVVSNLICQMTTRFSRPCPKSLAFC